MSYLPVTRIVTDSTDLTIRSNNAILLCLLSLGGECIFSVGDAKCEWIGLHCKVRV